MPHHTTPIDHTSYETFQSSFALRHLVWALYDASCHAQSALRVLPDCGADAYLTSDATIAAHDAVVRLAEVAGECWQVSCPTQRAFFRAAQEYAQSLFTSAVHSH